MAVACAALVAGLAETAAALPSGKQHGHGRDVVNGAVRSGDIGNSTVRGRDVRGNALTGSDVRESSLGLVPRAATAGTAGTANTAGAAAFAGTAATAGSTTGVYRSAQIRANDDDIPIVTLAGFALRLVCDLDNLATNDDAEIVMENVSAGDDAHFDADNLEDRNLDQGEESVVLARSNDETDGPCSGRRAPAAP